MDEQLDLGATIKGFSPGQKVFARYTLKKILGRGGMGVVWLARDEELERDIALKFLPEVVAMDKQSLNELKRETRRSLELTHPHIIRIYDFVQDGRTAAISMEYVAGDTLAALKADRPGHCFDPADLEKWVGQLCEALAHAHGRAGVVHRDLKPANLMVDARGDLKVADFGIAASVSDSVSRVSNQSGSSGTPVYMSPQQMMGEKPAVTDDIYSLGATLYDLLTGKPPFHSGNIIAQVQAKVPPPVAERRADLGVGGAPIPPAWEETIAACLTKDPATRPPDAGAFFQALKGQGSPAPAAPANVPNADASVRSVTVAPQPEVQRPIPSAPAPTAPAAKKSILPRVVAATLALVGLGFAGWWFGVHAPEQARQAEAARVQAEEARIAAEQKREAEVQAERQRQAEAARQAEIARLAALRIPVTLRTEPTGAEIIVGGQSRGLAPVAGLPLPLGEHKVIARLRDHDDLEYTFAVVEKGQTEWTLPLVRSTGLATLYSVPQGARFAIHALNPDGTIAAAPRATGTLPTEAIKLETGRYEVVITPTPAVPGLEHREKISVVKGEIVSVEADVRTTSLQVNSTPAGATVVVDGREVGKTPFLLDRQVPGARRQVELRLPGYEPANRTVELSRRDAPETWEASLVPVPKLVLRPDFSNGPRELDINIRINSTTSGQTVAAGQVTPIPETRNNSALDSRYTVLAYDAGGQIRRVSSTAQSVVNGTKVFQPGSVLDFDWSGGEWKGAFRAGGFAVAGMSLEFLSPSYPATWLDSRLLPEGPAAVGRSWDVPASAATVLIPSLRFQTPTGTIRGRVTRIDEAAGWADIEYAFDLRGQLIIPQFSRNALAAGQVMTMTGAYAGTITLRHDVASSYISGAHVKHRGGIETKVLTGAQNVLAQTTMSIDTDVVFTIKPAQGPPPVADDAAATGRTPVVFYRRNNVLMGVAARIILLADGKRIGSLRDGEFLRTELPAGPIKLQALISALGIEQRTPEVEVILSAGTERYFEFAMMMSGNGLQSRTAEDGARGIARLKPARPETK